MRVKLQAERGRGDLRSGVSAGSKTRAERVQGA